jgi:peptide/nickel transport system substrate-binding protein
MWKTGLTTITTRGNVVSFNFKGVPNYQDWDTNMYSIPIVPRHVWSRYSATEITTGNADESFVVTGPFSYAAGKGGSQTLQLARRANWWATKALGKRMPMRYLVDIHNTSNTASLQNFLQNRIDLSNNFFPGIDKQIGGKIKTYYAKAPYMLAANTAWLVPNTTKAPLSDRAFRRALAMSINVNRIVVADYGNIVSKANPTGLLPTWSKWVDQAQAKKLGFTYNVNGAKALLAANGYRDRDGDGFVENKDGSDINLRLIVPNGWSDWMTAIQIIADSTKAAGIKITPAYPDFNGLVEERNSGKFDLVINNDKQIGNTPYTYYDYLFHLPIADQQTFANFSRFTQSGARPWALTLALNKVKTSQVAKAKKIHSQIQKYILEQLPAIPLWYNGMWAQYNTSVWTNFPSAAGKGLQNTPSTWNGYLNMTGIDALANLKKNN